MHIETQICGIVIQLLLIFFFSRYRKVGLYSERIFVETLVISTVGIMLDAVSCIAIVHADQIPVLLTAFVCKLYLAALVTTTCAGFIYAISDIMTYQKLVKAKIISYVICLVFDLMIMIHPIAYFYDGESLYTYGAAPNITYVGAPIFIVTTLVVTCVFYKKMNYKRARAVLVWMIIWLGAATIQFMNSKLLVVGFASVLGMLIVFCVFENPDNKTDRGYGCFHANAMMEYLHEQFELEKDCSVLLISMVGQQSLRENEEYLDKSVRKLIQALLKDKSIKVFKNIGAELVVVFKDMSKMNSVFQEIQDGMYYDHFYGNPSDTDTMPKTLFVLLPDIKVVHNAEEVLSVFEYLKVENHNMDRSQVSYVNQMILNQLRNEEAQKNMILDALKEDRVEVFFQPIYSSISKRFVSAEALVRIRDVDGGIIPPGRFIGIAEETGLILPLGERVFEKTCEFISASKILEYGVEYVEVNLSVIQCQQHNLAEQYLGIMNKYNLDPWRINLEITETGSVEAKTVLLEHA